MFGAICLTGTAFARPDYVDYMPNGDQPDTGCVNCHPSVGGVTDTNNFNLLGQYILNADPPFQVNGVAQAPEEWWGRLYNVDADKDAQTNGQELGDPCGDWTLGAKPPRTTGLSNPGETDSVSPTPDVPACNGAGGAGGTGGAGGAGAAGGTMTDPTTTTSNPAGGGSTGSNGQGGSKQSTAAGPAEPPLTPQANCSWAPAAPGTDGSLIFLAAAGLLLVRYRRKASK